jgi:lysophospholipase L1-like esterase
LKVRTTLWIVAVVIVALAAAELELRATGIHRIPLFRSDAHYEYFTLPDQVLRIGAARFVTNALGMRNGPIGPKKGRRVLVIGDSVINGGFTLDQDSMATERANAKARAEGRDVEYINLSANSWGAGNVAAFLKAHGTFDADAVIAVFSSHDAQDRMTFEAVVGVHPSFPERHPATAIGAALQRLRFRFASRTPPSEAPYHVRQVRFDPGWRQLTELLADDEQPFFVLFHAEHDELRRGTYNTEGTQLQDSLHHWNVPVTPLLPLLSAGMYDDGIHLNARGHAMLADVLWGHCGPTE